MEISALVPYECVGKCDKGVAERTRWEDAVNRHVDDVWIALVEGNPGISARLENLRKDELNFCSPALPLYAPPPSYDDAIADLSPDYSTLPPLATRKIIVSGAPATPATKSQDRSSALLKDCSLDVYIDFENPVGVREHKKKKGPTATKKATQASPPPDNGGGSDNAGDDQGAGDGGGHAGGGDGGGGDGDGDGDGGGDDGWNDWTTSSSKKKNKKKEEEEEEERKAAEAAAGNKLSWADDMDEGGADDSWAGFATVGKKKKGKVSLEIHGILNLSDPDCSPKPRLAGSKT